MKFRKVSAMKCRTTRPGKDCSFMSKAGCTDPGGTCYEVGSCCMGCGRISDTEHGMYCSTYADPCAQWRSGRTCDLATHVKREAEKEQKINPLKASKRANKVAKAVEAKK